MRRFSNQLTDWMAAWWPVLVVSFPIMFAAVRAAVGGWVPIGDDAYFTVRSRDVLTEHHPLLGAWSSGSLDLSTPINNLGPLQLDLLAPFTRWTPMGGTAIGVAVVNVASIAAIAWMARRCRPADVDDGFGDADHASPTPVLDRALPVPAGGRLGGRTG
jgi:hypothetical protein